MIDKVEVNISDGGGGDEIVKKTPPHLETTIGATAYLISNAKKAFTQLRQAFTKALILCHFDLECNIRIETNAFGHAIDRVLSQLTLNNLGQCHPVAYFLKKIIPAKTWYKLTIMSF